MSGVKCEDTWSRVGCRCKKDSQGFQVSEKLPVGGSRASALLLCPCTADRGVEWLAGARCAGKCIYGERSVKSAIKCVLTCWGKNVKVLFFKCYYKKEKQLCFSVLLHHLHLSEHLKTHQSLRGDPTLTVLSLPQPWNIWAFFFRKVGVRLTLQSVLGFSMVTLLLPNEKELASGCGLRGKDGVV